MNLDFTNLRKITGGDAVLETELFQMFLDSSHECFGFLKESWDIGQEEIWRANAHAFKGISFSIGAEELGQLCRHAQEHHMAEPKEKLKMLAAIEKEFLVVEDELKKFNNKAI
jgi:HPt (histidine-containing phosphotransfer) domain-containing protein